MPTARLQTLRGTMLAETAKALMVCSVSLQSNLFYKVQQYRVTRGGGLSSAGVLACSQSVRLARARQRRGGRPRLRSIDAGIIGGCRLCAGVSWRAPCAATPQQAQHHGRANSATAAVVTLAILHDLPRWEADPRRRLERRGSELYSGATLLRVPHNRPVSRGAPDHRVGGRGSAALVLTVAGDPRWTVKRQRQQ